MSSAEVGVYKMLPDGERTELHVRTFEGTVRMGTVFQRAYSSRDWLKSDPALAVALTVVRIVFYKRDIEFLERGYAGALFVVGKVPEAMAQGWVLVE
jgi:hypothetical protein